MLKSIVALVFFVSVASAYELKGIVDRVSDGDTLLIISEARVPYRVRLLHINSPERGKPYYKKSKLLLKQLIVDKTVTADCTWLDSFNRHLCEITHDGVNINREMIKRGGAWLHRKYYDYDADTKQLLPLQAQAKQQRVGLWRTSEYQKIPPWEYKN